MDCKKGNTFSTSLGAMWIGENSYNHDQAEKCCRSGGGSLASLTTPDVVSEMSKIMGKRDQNDGFLTKFYNWFKGTELIRLGVNITKGVGKWNNGEDFKCEFCELNVFMEKLLQESVNFHTISFNGYCSCSNTTAPVNFTLFLN